MTDDTLVNGLKAIFGTSQSATTIASTNLMPFMASNGDPVGLTGMANLASVLGGNKYVEYFNNSSSSVNKTIQVTDITSKSVVWVYLKLYGAFSEVYGSVYLGTTSSGNQVNFTQIKKGTDGNAMTVDDFGNVSVKASSAVVVEYVNCTCSIINQT